MRTVKKLLKWIFIVLFAGIGILLASIFAMQNKKFDAPYPDNIHASKDSAIIARGEYLVYGPAHCGNCHSPEENQQRINTGEHLPLQGGMQFALPIGNIYSPNITPDNETGIGKLTDAQLARAFRHGVGHDGRALFDFMPFQHMSNEDLTAVVSFLRSQKPVKSEIPKMDLNLLGKAVKAFLIKPVSATHPIPDKVVPDTTVAYGEYLANYVANCNGCHTERDLKTGAYIGEQYAGGTKFESTIEKGSYCVTPNLTPDPKTGRIYGWSEQQFLDRFHKPRVIAISEMPWELFSRMTNNDIKAIYKYLQTLKPVEKDNGPTYVKGS
jgi:mono/diheme cytochrome c family protein